MKSHCDLCHHPNHHHVDNNNNRNFFSPRCVLVNGPVIVGAGPSGLAVGAGLRQQGIPFVILERAASVASLWQDRTYDRLKLHLPKKFCQLPFLPFPEEFPNYPSKHQFTHYLRSYALRFDIRPRLNEPVGSARFDPSCALWRVRTTSAEYLCRWLVVASGENAEEVVPPFEGLKEFRGSVVHACDYKSGEEYSGKKVLVVGCGNSGMEVSLDLCHHNAAPLMVVRSSVHVLPREILGVSTFEVGVRLMRWMPVWAVDKILVLAARLILGETEKYGLKRPSLGPLQLKNEQGKTPVLDIGTLSKIKSGDIELVPGIERFVGGGVELVDGRVIEVDSVILATGYSSNVPSWLKENEFFSKDGFPVSPFTNGWKGQNGLYAVGFTKKGLSGVSSDAIKVSQDIGQIWNAETRQKPYSVAFSCNRRCKKHCYNSII